MLKVLKMENGGAQELKELIEGRTSRDLTSYQNRVDEIVKNVVRTGDMAVREYTRRFDKVDLPAEKLLVSQREIEDALAEVEDEFIKSLKLAAGKIESYHSKQSQNSWNMTEEDGVIMGQICRPLERVGVYVPGGSAAYPSSVLMTVIPAKVAGVDEVIMVTPPTKEGKVNPYILTAARVAGVDKVYRIGGAQAIAALAYGTATINKVDKIVGPGNIYVSLAKRSVYGQVDIDMIAGPSEILVIADESSNPRYLAADLLSQAEHDPLAASILVTTSERMASEVEKEIALQIEELPRQQVIRESINTYGRIILVNDLDQGVEIANRIAPEHLELAVANPFKWMPKVRNAGAIFLGEYAPEPLGDYLAGPNHVLPTNGTARFFSPLSVRDYVKYSSYLSYSREALEEVKEEVINLAEIEGLKGHANAIRVRFEGGKGEKSDL